MGARSCSLDQTRPDPVEEVGKAEAALAWALVSSWLGLKSGLGPALEGLFWPGFLPVRHLHVLIPADRGVVRVRSLVDEAATGAYTPHSGPKRGL